MKQKKQIVNESDIFESKSKSNDFESIRKWNIAQSKNKRMHCKSICSSGQPHIFFYALTLVMVSRFTWPLKPGIERTLRFLRK